MATTNDIYEIADEHERIRDLLKVFKQCDADWNEIRTKSQEDLKFYNGDQYDEQQARAARAIGNRVVIKLNMIAQYVQQVDNMRRQKDIALTCHATDEAGSEETAEIYEGLFRHIEDISSAKHAYNAAFGPSGALVAGLGFIKVETDYMDEDSFNQEIFIRAVKDPNKILPDFNCKCPVFSDSNYWFEFDDMSKDDFKHEYPEARLSSFPTWNNLSKKTDGWVTNNTVRLAKYWYKEKESYKMVQYEDGTIAYEEDDVPMIPYTTHELMDMDTDNKMKRLAFNNETDSSVDEEIPLARQANVIKTRTIEKSTIKWLITNGFEILEEGEWHNDAFPFVPAIGNELIIEGKRMIHGITRFSREPQQIVNYLSSELVRKTAATTKSQWKVDIDAVPVQFRKDWMSSNVSEKAVLFWTSKANGRENIPAPERIDMMEPQMSNLLASINNSKADIKQTMGLTPQSADALSGKPASDQSGVAIQTLAEQGELANFHFSDNTVLAMKRLGEIVIGLIPFVYDTPRVVRVIGADSTAELVKINQLFDENGKQKCYDLSCGKYGVVVDTGPGFATKKAQQSEQMIRFAQLDPELTGILAGDIARNADWDTDGSMQDKIIQWQAMKYPGLDLSGKGQQDIPPQAKAMIIQLQKQVQVANQHVQILASEVQNYKMEEKSNAEDNAAKIRLALIDRQTKLDLKRADIQLELLTTKDNLEQIKLQAHLDQINETRKLVMEHVQHIDKLNQNTLKG